MAYSMSQVFGVSLAAVHTRVDSPSSGLLTPQHHSNCSISPQLASSLDPSNSLQTASAAELPQPGMRPLPRPSRPPPGRQWHQRTGRNAAFLTFTGMYWKGRNLVAVPKINRHRPLILGTGAARGAGPHVEGLPWVPVATQARWFTYSTPARTRALRSLHRVISVTRAPFLILSGPVQCNRERREASTLQGFPEAPPDPPPSARSCPPTIRSRQRINAPQNAVPTLVLLVSPLLHQKQGPLQRLCGDLLGLCCPPQHR